jgi:hypothetical protein
MEALSGQYLLPCKLQSMPSTPYSVRVASSIVEGFLTVKESEARSLAPNQLFHHMLALRKGLARDLRSEESILLDMRRPVTRNNDKGAGIWPNVVCFKVGIGVLPRSLISGDGVRFNNQDSERHFYEGFRTARSEKDYAHFEKRVCLQLRSPSPLY